MTIVIVVLVLLGLPLWRAVAKTKTLVRQLTIEAEQKLHEDAYHHLIELGNLLSRDVLQLKLELGGKEKPTKKLASKLAKLKSESHPQWATRLTLIRIVDRLNRLGQAEQMEIFSPEMIWESNGEAILAAHERTHYFVEALQEINSDMFANYTILVDELQRTSAQLKMGEQP